ncbi:MAG: hypothetical protein KBA26_12410, partial [Candidatus Delongbacteria bacterium]|nr:hypothetical protein [Candidatus Delongbacteria bacterium]
MHKWMIRFVMMIGIMATQSIAEEMTGSIPGNSVSDNPQVSSSDSSVRVSVLPYPFYSNIFQFGIGGFCSVSGLVSENSLMKAGGFISTNSSILGYLQYEEFQIPKMERIFVRPDLLFGKLGTVKNYMDLPLPREKSFDTKPGVNESDRDNYFEVEGDYQWYECTFSYLLPIGYGRKHKVAHPVLRKGLLVGGETGGYHFSPWVCGRTFLQSRLSYRPSPYTHL